MMVGRLPTVYHTIAIPFAVLMLLLAWGFLKLTAQIETDELGFRLNSLAVRSESVDASDILLRLQQEQRANAGSLTRKTIPTDELSLLSAFPERASASRHWLKSDSLDVRFFSTLIVWLQGAAGIRPVASAYLENEIDLTTLAYNLERRRFFSEALVTFRKALKPSVSAATQDFILLHMGYCMFFLSEYSNAQKSWENVLTSGTTAANRATAERLLAWLRQFLAGHGAAAKISNPRQRALQYYQILAYKESLEALLQVAEYSRDDKYYLLRGRAHEGPGDYALAVEDYRKTILQNRQSDAAVLANRRLYFMGAFYRPHDKLAAAAKVTGKKLNDDLFYEEAAQWQKSEESPLQTEKRESVDYAPEKIVNELISAEAEKPAGQPRVPARKVIMRVKTRNGSIITGRLVRRNTVELVIENDNGRFRIPSDDIESKEILSGN
jgi:tetratricopeptide (TPR) repeat protein